MDREVNRVGRSRRKQKARVHSSGEAEHYAAVSATRDWKFGQNSYCTAQPHVAYAGVNVLEPYANCQHVLWPQQLVKRGVVTVGACPSAENRAELGRKSLPAHRLRHLRQWNGLVLERNENLVTGDQEDGQDENEQEGAAGQQSPILGRRRRSPGRTNKPSKDEVSIQSDARCMATSG